MPYVYHYATELAKSHKLLMAIVPKELDKLGFKISSKPNQWEKFAYNDSTVVVATAVPRSASKTYVHVLATSERDAYAKKWAADVMNAIKNSKIVLAD